MFRHEVAEGVRAGQGHDSAAGAVAHVQEGVALLEEAPHRRIFGNRFHAEPDGFLESEEVAFVASEGPEREAEDGTAAARRLGGEGAVEIGHLERASDRFPAPSDGEGDGGADWVAAEGAAVFPGAGDAAAIDSFDDIVLLQSGGFGRGTAGDSADDDGFRFTARLVVVFRPVIDGQAEVGPGAGPIEEAVEGVGDIIRWDGETVSFCGGVVVRPHEFAGDHADDVAAEADERAAGIAGIDGAGGLQVGGVGIADAAVAFADDAVGDRFAEVERAAESEHHVSGADLVGVCEAERGKAFAGRAGFDAEDREIELVILVHEGGLPGRFLAVESDREGIEGSFDDVPVCDDVAFAGDDGSGADAWFAGFGGGFLRKLSWSEEWFGRGDAAFDMDADDAGENLCDDRGQFVIESGGQGGFTEPDLRGGCRSGGSSRGFLLVPSTPCIAHGGCRHEGGGRSQPGKR